MPSGRQKIVGMILMLFVLTGLPCSAYGTYQETLPVCALRPNTVKASSRSIKISWSSKHDVSAAYYYVMRRGTKNNRGRGKWKTIARLKSDRRNGGAANVYVDRLKSTKAQQYEYKICILSAKGEIDTRDPAYTKETDTYAALGTNIKICIDPGHYGSLNNNYDLSGENGRYRYSEARFTLLIGQALKKKLKNDYGIDSYMTRTGRSISLTYNRKKYANAKLDKKNIAVRGYMAGTKGCDLFISLHTNATARETDPWNQPSDINKVNVFVNKTAHASSRGMRIANAIGVNLTAYNRTAGIQTAGFVKRGKNSASRFSDKANDSLGSNGTVVYRRNSKGADYYGVLRGASEKKVQGVLVEHAYHVTQVVREQALASPALYESWAACDAYGIAYGFGFVDTGLDKSVPLSR